MDLEPVRDAYSSIHEEYIRSVADDWTTHEDDTSFIRRHLTGLSGPVLDLGCGPGHWTAYLHSLGADVTGVDIVPEFIAHARATHPGPEFRLGSMAEVKVPAHSVAGILAWYSTIHLPQLELDRMLAEFRRLLVPAGLLVVGFFDGDDDVAGFDHRVITAYRWPVDVFAEHLGQGRFRRGAASSTPVPGTTGPQVRRDRCKRVLIFLEVRAGDASTSFAAAIRTGRIRSGASSKLCIASDESTPPAADRVEPVLLAF